MSIHRATWPWGQVSFYPLNGRPDPKRSNALCIDLKVEITGSPLLGEQIDEVLAELVSAPSGLGRCIRPRRFGPAQALSSSKTARSGAAFLFPRSSAGRPSGLAEHKPPT